MNQRRSFFKNTLGLALGASAALSGASANELASRIKSKTANKYEFYGTHQQGIATPAQKFIYFLVLLQFKLKKKITRVKRIAKPFWGNKRFFSKAQPHRASAAPKGVVCPFAQGSGRSKTP